MLEPRGEKRADLRMGRVCATVANRGRGKYERDYTAADFLFPFTLGPKPGRADPRALKAKLLAHTANRGGVIHQPKG